MMSGAAPPWASEPSPWGAAWREIVPHAAWFDVYPSAPPFAETGELRFRLLRRRPAEIPRVLWNPDHGEKPLASPLGQLMDAGPAALLRAMGSVSQRELQWALDCKQPERLFERARILLSPAADAFRAELHAQAAELTRQRFHQRVRLYAPLYLSNHCDNCCSYCHFSFENQVARATLDAGELEHEAFALAESGTCEVLLLTGEARRRLGVAELVAATSTARSYFSAVGIEAFPVSASEYAALRAAGARSVTVYQETYDAALYTEVHRAGRKRDLLWRLGALERAGSAGFRELGIGALLGLGEWRYEGVALALHAAALRELFPAAGIAVSFPRLREGPAGYRPPRPVSDEQLEHLMAVLRLLLPDANLVLSTREPPQIRDRLAARCITRLSAGSATSPGGYAGTRPPAAEQFEVHDRRSTREVRARLRAGGLEVR